MEADLALRHVELEAAEGEQQRVGQQESRPAGGHTRGGQLTRIEYA